MQNTWGQSSWAVDANNQTTQNQSDNAQANQWGSSNNDAWGNTQAQQLDQPSINATNQNNSSTRFNRDSSQRTRGPFYRGSSMMGSKVQQENRSQTTSDRPRGPFWRGSAQDRIKGGDRQAMRQQELKESQSFSNQNWGSGNNNQQNDRKNINNDGWSTSQQQEVKNSSWSQPQATNQINNSWGQPAEVQQTNNSKNQPISWGQSDQNQANTNTWGQQNNQSKPSQQAQWGSNEDQNQNGNQDFGIRAQGYRGRGDSRAMTNQYTHREAEAPSRGTPFFRGRNRGGRNGAHNLATSNNHYESQHNQSRIEANLTQETAQDWGCVQPSEPVVTGWGAQESLNQSIAPSAGNERGRSNFYRGSRQQIVNGREKNDSSFIGYNADVEQCQPNNLKSNSQSWTREALNNLMGDPANRRDQQNTSFRANDDVTIYPVKRSAPTNQYYQGQKRIKRVIETIEISSDSEPIPSQADLNRKKKVVAQFSPDREMDELIRNSERENEESSDVQSIRTRLNNSILYDPDGHLPQSLDSISHIIQGIDENFDPLATPLEIYKGGIQFYYIKDMQLKVKLLTREDPNIVKRFFNPITVLENVDPNHEEFNKMYAELINLRKLERKNEMKLQYCGWIEGENEQDHLTILKLSQGMADNKKCTSFKYHNESQICFFNINQVYRKLQEVPNIIVHESKKCTMMFVIFNSKNFMESHKHLKNTVPIDLL